MDTTYVLQIVNIYYAGKNIKKTTYCTYYHQKTRIERDIFCHNILCPLSVTKLLEKKKRNVKFYKTYELNLRIKVFVLTQYTCNSC